MFVVKSIYAALVARLILADPGLDEREVIVTHIETRNILSPFLEARADPITCYTVAASTNAFSSCVDSANSFLTAHGGCSTGIYTNTVSAIACECSYISLAYGCDRSLCPNIDTASLPATLSVPSTLRSIYSLCKSAGVGPSSQPAATTSKATGSSTKPSSTTTKPASSSKPSSSTTKPTTSSVRPSSGTTSSARSSSSSSAPVATATRAEGSRPVVGGDGLMAKVGSFLVVLAVGLVN